MQQLEEAKRVHMEADTRQDLLYTRHRAASFLQSSPVVKITGDGQTVKCLFFFFFPKIKFRESLALKGRDSKSDLRFFCE